MARAHRNRDHTDPKNPRKGGRKYPGVGVPPPAESGEAGGFRLGPRNPEYFSANQPHGKTTSYPPTAYRPPGPGGRPQSR